MDRIFAWLAEYSYACVLIAAAIDAMALPFQDVSSMAAITFMSQRPIMTRPP
jgi:hypothetical protein